MSKKPLLMISGENGKTIKVWFHCLIKDNIINLSRESSQRQKHKRREITNLCQQIILFKYKEPQRICKKEEGEKISLCLISYILQMLMKKVYK
jgi:hypothetical protein